MDFAPEASEKFKNWTKGPRLTFITPFVTITVDSFCKIRKVEYIVAKMNNDFQEVPVSRRSARSLSDEDALKLDDAHEIHPAKKREPENVKNNRDDRRRKNSKKKSGKGKVILLLLLAIIALIALIVGGKMFLDGGGFSQPAPTEPQTEAPSTEPVVEENHIQLVQDGNAEILNLVKGYYDARSIQDTEAMAAALIEGSVINEQELANEAEFLEAYQDISTYVTDGLQEGENVVYVTYNMKFKDIAAAAPGMVPAYVKADESGALRLMPMSDFDAEVQACVAEANESLEVKALLAQIKADYEAAQSRDSDLKAFIDALEGRTPETEAPETEEGESEAAETEDAEAAENNESAEAATTAPTTPITFTETDDIQYATTQVKCRPEPSTDGDEYTLVEAGEWVHVIGISDEWYKVNTQDHVQGYIKAEYLSVDKPETSVE